MSSNVQYWLYSFSILRRSWQETATDYVFSTGKAYYVNENGDIIRNSEELFFPWQIRVSGGLNSSPKLSYVLEPSQQYDQIKLPEDYEKLIVDIDLITLKILEVFEKPLSHEEENEDVTKPKKLF